MFFPICQEALWLWTQIVHTTRKESYSYFHQFFSHSIHFKQGVVRGVATTTPIFQNLFYKIDQKISQRNFLFSIGYTNLKFQKSSRISNSIGRWLQFSNLLDKTIWLWSWKGASPLNLLQWPRKRPFRDDFLSGLTINHIIRYVWGKKIWNICAIFYAMVKISMKKRWFRNYWFFYLIQTQEK